MIPLLAFFDGIGGSEIMIVMALILILFGPDKLPGLARGLGKTVREFKKAASSVEEQFKQAMEEEEEAGKPPVPRGPVAQPPLPPHKLPPYIPPVPPPKEPITLPIRRSEVPVAAVTPLGPAALPPLASTAPPAGVPPAPPASASAAESPPPVS